MNAEALYRQFAGDADGAPDIPLHIFEEIEARFPKYLFFRTVKRNLREYTCTGCHEVFFEGAGAMHELMQSEDFALWHAGHKEMAVCPRCGCEATVRNVKIGDMERLDQSQWIAVFIAVSHDEAWFRCVNAYRCYHSNEYGGRTAIIEWCRYRLTPGAAAYYKRESGNRGLLPKRTYEEPFSWNNAIYTEKYRYELVRGSVLDIDDTFLKYHGFEHQKFYGAAPFIRYLCHYAVHPQLEMLGKLGHHDAVWEIVMENRENRRILDFTAKNPWGMFRLTHSEYNIWRGKYHKDFNLLKVYRRIRGKGEKDFEASDTLLSMANSSLSGAYTVIAEARKLKLDPRQVVKYVEKVQRNSAGGCHMCPGITLSEACFKWLDYIDMAKAAGLIDTASALPKDLSEAHDRMLAAVNHRKYLDDMAEREKQIKEELRRIKKIRAEAEKKGAELEKKYRKIRGIYASLAGKYAYGNEKYTISLPTGIADIIVEGEILHHCIASVDRYYERIESNESYLMFLRRTDKPDEPYYTLEVEPGGTVRQKRTYYDRQNHDIQEATEFLKEWQKAIRSRLENSDRLLAEKSRRLREENFRELRENKVQVRNGFLRGKYLADVLEADLLEIGFEKTENRKEISV